LIILSLSQVYALEFAKLGASVVVNDLGGSASGAGAGSSLSISSV
jgi:hypothetical protein